jgi:4-hydroxy-tetrahydrodipicolinate synthase
MTSYQEYEARGVIIPLLTPFNESGEIHEPALEEHLEWLIAQGVGGIMPAGTTGEGPLLSLDERVHLIRKTVEIVQNRVPVMAHVGAITTRDTCHLAQAAADAGASAVSAVTPYYYAMTEDALTAHYIQVAQSVPELPVFLYTIPHCTTNDLNPEIVRMICARAPNVLGLKDSSGNLEKMIDYTAIQDGGFQVICGSDSLLLRALQGGAAAGVSGNANIFPEVVVELVRAYQAGHTASAKATQSRLNTVREILQDGGNLSLMKQALGFRGLYASPVRPPLPEAAPDLITSAQQALIQENLISKG